VRGLRAPLPHSISEALRDAVALVAVAAVLALCFNALRGDGLPLVATEPYEIFVPCPEPVGDAFPLVPADVAWGDPSELVIDARPAQAFGAWHADGAVSVPYDFLDPVAPDRVADLVSSGASRVVVYGDGLVPDTGEELGRELAGRGMRNVHFVQGGAAAVRVFLGLSEVAP
jgi:hypothetical protein